MIRKSIATVFCVLLALPLFAGWGEDLVSEHFDQTYSMSETGRISLENINGNVTVRVWDRAEVRVEAEKKASTNEILEMLKIQVDANENSIDIETDYPSSRSFSRDRGTSMTVKYTLTVPRRANVDAIELINGSIEIEGVEGGVTAESINGKIVTRNVAGAINLSTVNGRIEPQLDSMVGVEKIDLETVNGSVNLALDPGAGVTVDVETVNGSISNDFGLRVNKHKYVGADLRGDIGGGGILVSIETVNGSVDITQR